MSRTLSVKILKYDPNVKGSKPGIREYKIEETTSMTIFILLNQIRETEDADLSYDFVCRAGICGSCGMMINGKPSLACRTLTSDLPEEITLLPMPAFKLLKDLSVDTGNWMNDMSKRVESWIHSQKRDTIDISKIEERVDPKEANDVFELDRCIECGLCVASCGTKVMRPDFVGAVGLNRVARFHMDSHDERTEDDFYELIGDDNGIFGCMSLMGCEDHCPKHLPLQNKIAYLRRKMVEAK